LAEQKGDELVAGLELAHQFIAPVLFHKPIENSPRNKFENIAKDAILLVHGVDPFSYPDDSKPTGTE